MTWTVNIVETATGRVERAIPCSGSERQAQRVERGVLINLNHDKFHTQICFSVAESSSKLEGRACP